jgi:adenylate kinase family enzyme
VGVQHFSAGDLLREAVKSGNKELEDIMREGKLVPMEVRHQASTEFSGLLNCCIL